MRLLRVGFVGGRVGLPLFWLKCSFFSKIKKGLAILGGMSGYELSHSSSALTFHPRSAA